MKGSKEVIEVLNDVLSAELTGVNQYFVHAMMCANWRYQRLAEHTRKESIEGATRRRSSSASSTWTASPTCRST